MKQRILMGWTFKRGLYVTLGLIVIVQSVTQQQWFGTILGAYFTAMGIFAFGCASGDCFSGNCNTEIKNQNNQSIENINFEEVKTK